MKYEVAFRQLEINCQNKSRFDSYEFTFKTNRDSTDYELIVEISRDSIVMNYLSTYVAIGQLRINCRNKSQFGSYELTVETSRNLTVMN